ncbi:predicted protein [Plenodomus lingam JN3]|uniref:Predicted protein n=2 Tax=Leptosphaeria maculans TaxID=5022 RepID=E5ADL8_LEPMJ|nr:predicted protein [Plenodomus lingam JN3]CBY01307.1 predicted protein [Plenodomus lingam JN3]
MPPTDRQTTRDETGDRRGDVQIQAGHSFSPRQRQPTNPITGHATTQHYPALHNPPPAANVMRRPARHFRHPSSYTRTMPVPRSGCLMQTPWHHGTMNSTTLELMEQVETTSLVCVCVWTVDSGLWTVDCGLRTVDCGLLTAATMAQQSL